MPIYYRVQQRINPQDRNGKKQYFLIQRSAGYIVGFVLYIFRFHDSHSLSIDSRQRNIFIAQTGEMHKGGNFYAAVFVVCIIIFYHLFFSKTYKFFLIFQESRRIEMFVFYFTFSNSSNLSDLT